jgi:acetyl-CoA carboxylase carboxyl transferase subunit alpha
MLEHSVYSVITVEGCAAILWKDGKSPEMRERAASALRITAPDLLDFGVIDEIVPEPPGGAHVDHERMAKTLRETLARHIEDLRRSKPERLVRRRREKFLRMGVFEE